MKFTLLLLVLCFSFGQCQSNKTIENMNIQDFTPANTAIIVIEFQKTWTEKGFFHALIKKELKRKATIQNTIQFLNAARNKGYTVIQAPLILSKNDKKNYKKIPLIPKLFNGFTINTWKAEFTEGIFRNTDLVVEGRCGFDACKGSNLETLVDNLKVKYLLFCGFTTEHCVEMTMNTLIKKGYYCVLVSDCTATKSKRLQNKVENRQSNLNSKLFFSINN